MKATKYIDPLKKILPIDNQSCILNIPIYEHDILLVIGVKELKRIIPLNTIKKDLEVVLEDCDEGTAGYNHSTETRSIIYLPSLQGLDFYEFMKILTHEVRHATDHILHFKGQEFVPGGANEAYAYLNGYINKSLLEKIKFS